MIFLTGITGFLGKEILGRLLLLYPDEDFAVIVRSDSDSNAELRAQEALLELAGSEFVRKHGHRIKTIRGDLSCENFGLSPTDFSELSKQITAIYHCAASTVLNQPIDKARQANVGSTAQVIDLARLAYHYRKTPVWFHHVSTAYVAGDTDRTVNANELNLNRRFRNSYEQSKAESEALVRSLNADEIPYCIYRPSIIVGDSNTGRTSAFNVLYVPAKFIIKGLFQALPATPHAPFDVVPVNYVADGISVLSKINHEPGKAFHLSAGIGRETSPLEILDCIIRVFNTFKVGSPFEKPPFLSPEIIQLINISILKAMNSVKHLEKLFTRRIDIIKQTLPFIPYMNQNPRFDSSETDRALANLLAPPPLFLSYAEKIFRYCLETNWGKLQFLGKENSWAERINPIFLNTNILPANRLKPVEG